MERANEHDSKELLVGCYWKRKRTACVLSQSVSLSKVPSLPARKCRVPLDSLLLSLLITRVCVDVRTFHHGSSPAQLCPTETLTLEPIVTGPILPFFLLAPRP